jgi:hypothetical protein
LQPQRELLKASNRAFKVSLLARGPFQKTLPIWFRQGFLLSRDRWKTLYPSALLRTNLEPRKIPVRPLRMHSVG